MERKINFYLVGLGCLILFVGIFFLIFSTEKPVEEVVEIVATSTAPRYNPFDDVVISARSAVVFDANSGNLIYEKNSTTSRPLASVSKLMTVYTAAEILSPTSTIKIVESDLTSEGDNGFMVGEVWKIKDLMDITLVASSNDASEMIARAGGPEFIEKMNRLGVERGWLSFSFQNPSGLDKNDAVPTAFGSARDVAFLLKRILQDHEDLLEATREDFITRNSEDGVGHTFRNTNVTLANFPSVLGSKTGYTTSAGGNLAFVYSMGLNRPIIIVVLGSENQETRFKDVMVLASTTEAYLQSN